MGNSLFSEVKPPWVNITQLPSARREIRSITSMSKALCNTNQSTGCLLKHDDLPLSGRQTFLCSDYQSCHTSPLNPTSFWCWDESTNAEAALQAARDLHRRVATSTGQETKEPLIWKREFHQPRGSRKLKRLFEHPVMYVTLQKHTTAP